MSPVPIVILISGRGSNMEAIAESVQSGELKNICEVKAVICNVADAPGIGKAAARGIPVITLPSRGKSREEFELLLIEELKQFNPGYIILAGFNRVLTPVIIQQFKRRIINIHPADTKQYKGLHGYEWAFSSGLKETLITVHYVDEGVDTGEIIAQAKVNLEGAASLEEVVERGLNTERVFYSRVLKNLFLQENQV